LKAGPPQKPGQSGHYPQVCFNFPPGQAVDQPFQVRRPVLQGRQIQFQEIFPDGRIEGCSLLLPFQQFQPGFTSVIIPWDRGLDDEVSRYFLPAGQNPAPGQFTGRKAPFFSRRYFSGTAGQNSDPAFAANPFPPAVPLNGHACQGRRLKQVHPGRDLYFSFLQLKKYLPSGHFFNPLDLFPIKKSGFDRNRKTNGRS
jgi:hypothetical protein